MTIDAALAWSLAPAVPVGSVVPADRMMLVRGFARYLSGIDPRTEVPPAGTIRHPKHWRRPFIYADADVLAMIEQAAGADPAAVALSDLPDADRAARHDRTAGRGGASLGPRRSRPSRWCVADPGSRSSESRGSCRCRPARSTRSSATTTPASDCCPDPSTDSLFVSLRGTRVIYECVWPMHRKLCEHAGVGAARP